jgi:hypothetical protein
MNGNDVCPGLRVKVIRDEGTRGMRIARKILERRAVGKIGTVLNYVPGHSGNVWFVQQDNGVAAYCSTELEVA